MIVSHQPPTVVNRWWRGVGARVVLGLAIVGGGCGCFGATFEARGAEPTRGLEVLNVKVHVFVLLLFATLPDCSQNQTAVSDTLRLLSDF